MKRKFKISGKCIWCGKSEPEVSFKNKPHILPDSVGGHELGCDICDKCNSYFGSKGPNNLPSPDLIFKEIFNLERFFNGSDSITNGEKYRSELFPVIDGVLHIQQRILDHSLYADLLKRSFYEIFLQKYHAFTHDGHNNKFDGVRCLARYNANVNNLKVYYVHQQMLFRESNLNQTRIYFNDYNVKELNRTGFYSFQFLGFTFFLEIFKKKADNNRETYFYSFLTENALTKPIIEEFCTIRQLYDIFNYLQVNKIIIDH